MKRTVLLLMCTFASYTQAEVYKWVDENNHTHYGGTPPPLNHQSVSIENCDQNCVQECNKEARLVKERHENWEHWQDKMEKMRRKSKPGPKPDVSRTNKTFGSIFY